MEFDAGNSLRVVWSSHEIGENIRNKKRPLLIRRSLIILISKGIEWLKSLGLLLLLLLLWLLLRKNCARHGRLIRVRWNGLHSGLWLNSRLLSGLAGNGALPRRLSIDYRWLLLHGRIVVDGGFDPTAEGILHGRTSGSLKGAGRRCDLGRLAWNKQFLNLVRVSRRSNQDVIVVAALQEFEQGLSDAEVANLN